MAYHVQANIARGVTQYIGWFECGELLSGKFEEGFRLTAVWPGAILMDTKGVDGKDLRSITDDNTANAFRIRLRAIKADGANG